MIGKLIIIGAIVIAVFIFVPGSSKMVTDVISHEVAQDKKQADSKNPEQTPAEHNYQKYGFGGKLGNDPGSTTPEQTPADNSNNIPSSSQTEQPAYKTPEKAPNNVPPTSPSAPPINPTNSLSSDTNLANLPSSISDFYTVIQLKTTHEGNDVLINYDDTSKKTISVMVTLKNSEKEIFSGKFTSSKFHATVEDFPNTPHIIEMTVEHSVYGTLHGSAFVPSSSQDSTISGIFTKS